MNISSVQQNNESPAFGAYLVSTVPVNDFLRTVKMKNNANEYNKLWISIEQAVSKHPSDKYIFTETNCLYEQKNSVIGILKTITDEFVNRDAKRCSYEAVINVWREILNPKNEEAFHKLFGKEYAPQYKAWWEENVAPFWDKLSKIR